MLPTSPLSAQGQRGRWEEEKKSKKVMERPTDRKIDDGMRF